MEKLQRVVRWDSAEGKPGSGAMVVAWILLVVAAVFLVIGLNVVFTYNQSSRLVGGDAYNLQILATRGLAWISAGIVIALGSVVQAAAAIRAALLAQMIARESSDGTVLWTYEGQRYAIEQLERKAQ